MKKNNVEKEGFDKNKRSFIKKGLFGVGVGVGAALLSKIPFVKSRLFTEGISAINKTAAMEIDSSGDVQLANPLPVAQGGTNSATATAAKTALGVSDVPVFGESGVYLDGNTIVEKYSAAAGQISMVDTANTTAVFSTADNSYGQGIVQTNTLYDSTTEITSLLVEEVTKRKVPTQGTVDVSFDDGSSWSNGKAIGTAITSFTGTNPSGSDYQLKLKFNLGASYFETKNYYWVTTGALNEAKQNSGGCGTTSDALCFGGYTGARVTTTEIWSGSSWATTTALVAIKDDMAACGTTAAALSAGGRGDANPSNTTEKWIGSSWVTTTAIVNARKALAGCGTTAAALCFGGAGLDDKTEKWGGSIWVTTSALTEAKADIAGCGTTSAALTFGGYTNPYINTTEIWNGSTWATTTATVITYGETPGGCGTTSGALSIGGYTLSVRVNTTQKWNGSSWATTTNLLEARNNLAGCGTTSDALCFGGSTGARVSTTERWMNGTAGPVMHMWVTTGSLNVARAFGGGCGTTSGALVFGGATGGGNSLNTTEKWSGTVWETTGALNLERQTICGCGTASVALSIGGESGANFYVNTEKWSGTTWATTGNMVVGRACGSNGACGTTSAALVIGGATLGDDFDNTCEKWTGTWATTTVYPTVTKHHMICGTTSAALAVGGDTVNGGGGEVATCRVWSGSSWATTTNLLAVRSMSVACGTTAAALCFGGYLAANVNTTEKWDGSSWSTTPNIADAKRAHQSCGTASDALCAGGYSDAYVTKTERWIGVGNQLGFAAKIN